MSNNVYTIFHQENDPLTPFAVKYSISVLHEQVLTDEECVSLTQTILEKEGDIIKANPDVRNDAGTGLGGDSLTAKFAAYNMLQWEDNEVCMKIKEKLRYGIEKMFSPHEKVYAQMWGNVLRRGQAMRPHQHACDEYSFLSANICLQANGTQTVYQNPYGLDNIAFDNKPGFLTIFPEYLIHWTTTHNHGMVPRVTLGVDILTETALDPSQMGRLVEI